jgi:DNA-binding beta-propeller fold protein YncE
MNFSPARTRLVHAGAVVAAVALVAGCGSSYRPVVTPVNPSGPAAQVTSYAVVVSAPSTTTPGIATIIDYSGDTVMAQAPIGPGPTTFTIDETGSSGYTVNSDGTITNFPIVVTGSGSLQAKNVTYTTLPTTSQPVGLFSPSTGLWIPDLEGNLADVFSGSPQTLKLAVPVATTPVTIVGPGVSGQRDYAVSQNFDAPSGTVPHGVACNLSPTTAPVNGEADAIETSTYTLSARIPLGKCPVYAVQSPDNKRFFVLNRGSDTITVINSQNNTLDSCTPFTDPETGRTVTCHPSLPVSPAPGLAHAGPVYAEYSAATSQLVVANYDGNSISIIDVSLDEYGNDSPTFGTTFTTPVGNNPSSVTVLADASRAYTANQTDGTVTIVNLSSHTVEKTLQVIGHPRTVVSTQNSTYGKVYAASPDSPYLTIIRTDQDIVDTTVLVEGNIVDVRVTTQNGSSGNSNANSRSPGHGQPCYMPGATAAATLASCQTLP